MLQPINAAGTLRTYSPNTPTAPALQAFLQLASAKNPELAVAIQQFANRYGLLGIGRAFGPDGAVEGEAFADWSTEIHELWKAYERCQSLSKNPSGWWPWLVTLSPTGRRQHGRFVIDQPTDRRPTTHERRLLARALSKQMGEKLTQHTGTRVTVSVGRSRLEEVRVPKNLLGALWLQFTQRLGDDERMARSCGHCGARIDDVRPSGRRRRRDARFCSDTCRASHFQQAAKTAPERKPP